MKSGDHHRALADWPLLPVVHSADLLCLVGVLTMADIMDAYRGAEEDRPVNAPQGP